MSFRSGWEVGTSEWCDGVIGMEDGDGVARIVPARMHMGVWGMMVSRVIISDVEGFEMCRRAVGRKAV